MLVRVLSAVAVTAALSFAMAGGAEAKSAEAKALKACKKEAGWSNMHKGRRGSRAAYLLDECVRGKLGR